MMQDSFDQCVCVVGEGTEMIREDRFGAKEQYEEEETTIQPI